MIGRVREERGAVLVIVTLLLLALMGMLVLVVDVGGLFYRRVQLQNAADAAALAAAISCGKAEGVLEARAQADLYTLENSDSAFVAPGYPQFFPSCTAPSGRVTVLVRAQQQLFFAPAIGGGGSGQVQAQATAIWGGAGAGEHVAPLMLSAHRLTTCEIPPPPGSPIPEGGIICAFWWNNSPHADIEDLTNAEWGTLDLLKWDVTADTHCDNSTPPQFEEWMFQGFFEPLPINPGEHPLAPHTDPHTYVCRGQGNFGASLDNIIDDAIFDPAVDEEPLFLYFPVNDPFGQIDADGLPCVPLELLADPLDFRPCSVDKYDIIGFARLEIIALYKGNTPEAEAACPDLWVRDANARCMVARWVEYTTEGLEPDGGENFGLVPVKLID